MAVYVDEAIWAWVGKRWCHLLADDTDELHRFAAHLGVHRLIYQGPPKTTANTSKPSRLSISAPVRQGRRESAPDEEAERGGELRHRV